MSLGKRDTKSMDKTLVSLNERNDKSVKNSKQYNEI